MKKIMIPLTIAVLSLAPHVVAAETVHLVNPLGITDPRALAGRIISGLISVLGTITLLMFVYAGVLWITAQGDKAKVERGKHIMTYSVLGIAIIAGAYVFVNAIIQAFTTGSATGA